MDANLASDSEAATPLWLWVQRSADWAFRGRYQGTYFATASARGKRRRDSRQLARRSNRDDTVALDDEHQFKIHVPRDVPERLGVWVRQAAIGECVLKLHGDPERVVQRRPVTELSPQVSGLAGETRLSHGNTRYRATES